MKVKWIVLKQNTFTVDDTHTSKSEKKLVVEIINVVKGVQ